jgi:hypothetical protein
VYWRVYAAVAPAAIRTGPASTTRYESVRGSEASVAIAALVALAAGSGGALVAVGVGSAVTNGVTALGVGVAVTPLDATIDLPSPGAREFPHAAATTAAAEEIDEGAIHQHTSLKTLS